MKFPSLLVAMLFVLGLPPIALAQNKADANAVKATQIAAARKANAALMRQYTWHSRIEIFINGEVKDTRIELVSYLPDGKLQRTVLNDQHANMPIGFLRRAIAENEKQELETYLKGLTALLEEYTLPTAGKVLDFVNQANVIGPDASGMVEMTGHGVVVPGDTFSVWSDARSRQTRKVVVSSTFQGGLVNLTATFKTLVSRLTYVDFAEVTVPGKQIVLKLQNYDFLKPEPAMASAPPPPPPAAKAVAPPPPPPAPAAAATAPPPPPAGGHVPLGTVVSALPAGCAATEIGGIQYFKCASGDYYRAAVQGGSLVYMSTKP
jgi:hypothetical protein